MRFNSIGTLFLLFFLSLIVVSCNEDEDLTVEPLLNATEEAALRGGGSGGQNDGRGGDGRDGDGRGGDGRGGDDANALGAEIVTEWTDLLLEIERYAEGMRPNASARAMAYIYLAAYETARPNMRGYLSNTERLDGFSLDDDLSDRDYEVELALNACFADVLDHFLYNVPVEHDVAIDEMEQETRESLILDMTEQEIADAEAWGAYVAQQVIAYSQTDTEAETQILEPQPRSYEPPTGPGFWTYSADPERALFPYWESVRTFAVSTDQTTTVDPIPYSTVPGSAYRDEMEEVYQVNNDAREDDGEQLWIAEFWSDDVENLMMSPPVRQISIANQLIDQYDLSLAESLELMARIGFSLNDAAVAAWKYKYQHMVMRPSVYIRDLIDPEYQTNLFRLVFWPNPGFPGYPSGHSAFASAAGGIFIETFGNRTNFTDRSHEGREEFRGAPRTFDSFEQLAEENAFSRIPLGVHIRMDCVEGLRLGYEIADGVNDLRLRQNAR